MTDLTILLERHTLTDSPEPLLHMAPPEPPADDPSTSPAQRNSLPAPDPSDVYHPRSGPPVSNSTNEIVTRELPLENRWDDRMADVEDSSLPLHTVLEEDNQDTRPTTPRRSTEPAFSSTSNMLLPPRQRNRSPYSRSHLRAHSASSSLTAPPMARAHSLPALISRSPAQLSLPSSPLQRPSSPLRSPRIRSPHKPHDESFLSSGMPPAVCDISEDEELIFPENRTSPSATLTPGNTFLRRTRPPSSPLNQMFTTPTSHSAGPSSSHSSPLLGATRFNEGFPGDIEYGRSFSSSSMPSTPISFRSRSPSISSLETIPDTPDAEAEAIQADVVERLRQAAEKAEKAETEEKDGARRGSPDGAGLRGAGFGNRDKRKRWSVCGAERRGDLDLETIWED